MAPDPPDFDQGLARILSGLPREAAPDVALEEILERWAVRRRRLWTGAGLAAAAGLIGVALLAWPRAAERPPVHLNIQVVDVPDETQQPELEGEAPPEVRGP